jgi:hypothetical protein
MLVGCQANLPAELVWMLLDFPGIGVVRHTEQTQTDECFAAVEKAGARSLVLCNRYGSMAGQVAAALKRPNVLYACMGNEPYWEGVSVSAFAKECYAVLAALPDADRHRVSIACMAGTGFSPQALLQAEPRLRDVVTTLDTHPYDAYGTGPTGPAGVGGAPLKSGGQRYRDTHAQWVKLTGREVDVIVTEVGWCTPPYVPSKTPPGSLPLVTEAQQADYFAQAFADFAQYPWVKSVTPYHYLGYDKASLALNTHSTPLFNGVVHWDYGRKPAWQVLADAIRKFAPVPPVPPFAPGLGLRTTTPDGVGTVAVVADTSHVVVALDSGDVRGYLALELEAA